MKVLRVALDVPLSQLFDYRCGDATADDVGRRVAVPFGTRTVAGVIVEVTDSSEIAPERLKAAEHILRDAVPPLPQDWLALAKFCSTYYQKPLGEVILGTIPPRLRITRELKPRKKPASELTHAEPSLPERHALHAEQQASCDAVRASFGRFGVFHLFGVTGSGKTEVYLHLIEEVLAAGQQALVLVPEIALTPALEAAFRARFPGYRLVVQHSAMPAGERAQGWIAAQTGAANIVLGTRLAVFVPLLRPGLIVVDEEQDASFKQRDGLRYSARDVAVFRARESGTPALLVSATPSLETFQHALTGRYELLRLTRRAHAAARMPTIRLIDTRVMPPTDGLCAPLVDALRARLERNEQSLVFLNRRGYAPVLACNYCGWVSGCPRCSAHLVVHLGDRLLRCHHCGREERIPRECPECGNLELVPFGRGTQRLEATLAELLPSARILRIDSDSAAKDVSRLIDLARAGEADILVGTQMLAKGHHFERVTLVGVLNADAGLFAADYRAPERLFAQLQQVAGRAGRADLPGEVLIQTRFPTHPLYRALEANDYEGYAKALLEERRRAGFPPFVFEAALRAEAPELEDAMRFLRLAVEAAPRERERVTVYDPAPATMTRVASRERAQVVVQSPSRPALQAFLSAWSATLYGARQGAARWHFDVDPIEF